MRTCDTILANKQLRGSYGKFELLTEVRGHSPGLSRWMSGCLPVMPEAGTGRGWRRGDGQPPGSSIMLLNSSMLHQAIAGILLWDTFPVVSARSTWSFCYLQPSASELICFSTVSGHQAVRAGPAGSGVSGLELDSNYKEKMNLEPFLSC